MDVGVGVVLTTPPGFSYSPVFFFAKSGKTAVCSADIFRITFNRTTLHTSRQFQLKVISGQVTKSGQVTLIQEIFMTVP